VTKSFDCVLITGVTDARALTEAAIVRFGADRVLVPEMLRVRIKKTQEAIE